MKKVILLIALSVLLCSAPGNAAGRQGDGDKEMKSAFAEEEEAERNAAREAWKAEMEAILKELTPEERIAKARAMIIKECNAGYAAFLARRASAEAATTEWKKLAEEAMKRRAAAREAERAAALEARLAAVDAPAAPAPKAAPATEPDGSAE